MASYYRDFIPNFATIALSLTELTKDTNRKFEFNTTQLSAFNALKVALSQCATLATPQYDRPFIIQTDASEYAVGACLAQLDDLGREKPLCYASSKLTAIQRRWSVIEKESYAVMFTLNKFGHTVYNSPINLFCDHNPLIHLINGIPSSPKLTCWSLSLQKFDINLQYKKGILNMNADCLSRLM